jgi:hypothetical protein
LVDLGEELRKLVDAHRALRSAPTRADEVARSDADAPGVTSSSFYFTHFTPPFISLMYSFFSFFFLFFFFFFFFTICAFTFFPTPPSFFC